MSYQINIYHISIKFNPYYKIERILICFLILQQTKTTLFVLSPRSRLALQARRPCLRKDNPMIFPHSSFPLQSFLQIVSPLLRLYSPLTRPYLLPPAIYVRSLQNRSLSPSTFALPPLSVQYVILSWICFKFQIWFFQSLTCHTSLAPPTNAPLLSSLASSPPLDASRAHSWFSHDRASLSSLPLVLLFFGFGIFFPAFFFVFLFLLLFLFLYKCPGRVEGEFRGSCPYMCPLH